MTSSRSSRVSSSAPAPSRSLLNILVGTALAFILAGILSAIGSGILAMANEVTSKAPSSDDSVLLGGTAPEGGR